MPSTRSSPTSKRAAARRRGHGWRAAVAARRVSADAAPAHAGKTVLIETGGHRSIVDVPAGVIRIMDVKCPGSGGRTERLEQLRPSHDEGRSEVRDRGSPRLRIRQGDVEREPLPRGSTRCCSRPCMASSIETNVEWVIADRLDVGACSCKSQVHLESRDAWGLSAGAGSRSRERRCQSRSSSGGAVSIPIRQQPSQSVTASRFMRLSINYGSVMSRSSPPPCRRARPRRQRHLDSIWI